MTRTFREFPLRHPYTHVPSGVLPAVHVPLTTIQEDPDASPDAGPMSNSDAGDIVVHNESGAGPIAGPMSDSDVGDIAVQHGSDAGPIAGPISSSDAGLTAGTDGPDASGDMPGMY